MLKQDSIHACDSMHTPPVVQAIVYAEMSLGDVIKSVVPGFGKCCQDIGCTIDVLFIVLQLLVGGYWTAWT